MIQSSPNLIPALKLIFEAIQTFPETRQNEIGQILLDAITQETLPVISFSDEEKDAIQSTILEA